MDVIHTISLARKLWRAERLSEAICLLQELVAKEPSEQEGVLLLATMLLDVGRAHEAEQVLSMHTVNSLEEPRRLSLIAQAWSDLGAWHRAAATYRQSLSLDPQAHRYVLLANCLDEVGEKTNAIQALELALQLEPGNDEALLLLARLLEDDDPVRSIAMYRSAANANPHSKEAWYGIGKMLLRDQSDEDVRAAIQSLQKAIDLGDRSAWAFAYLGNAYWRAGEMESAEEAFRAGCGDKENLGFATYHLVTFLRALCRECDVAGVWEKALALQPRSEEVDRYFRKDQGRVGGADQR